MKLTYDNNGLMINSIEIKKEKSQSWSWLIATTLDISLDVHTKHMLPYYVCKYNWVHGNLYNPYVVACIYIFMKKLI